MGKEEISIFKFAFVASGARHAKAFVAASASKTPLSTAPQTLGARNGRSGPLGAARALEMATRARSASLGRSKLQLGFVGAVEIAAQARSASLKRLH